MSIPLFTLLAFGAPPAEAADHGEAPLTEEDPAADLADVYAWHADGTLTAVITWGPKGQPGDPAELDKSVLYAIHIDTDGDSIADHDIVARFGQSVDTSWGVMIEGLPGTSEPLVGALDTELSEGSAKAWAGVREDPFFFDRDGFVDTVSTGSVAFTGADFYEGLNVTALVVELPLSELGDPASLQVWATTSRL